ncbi:MAG: HAMP domain-containing protein [Burkholderiales bacterium]|nr:HAMP domain-containing protein [Burkholderiales bacterium]
MRSLYLRIYLTVVAALALFALVSGWVVQRTLEEQRVRVESAQRERMSAWGDLLQRSLPSAEAPREEQAAALREWSQRLRLPMALDDAEGVRIGASEMFARREADGRPGFTERVQTIRLDDGRLLRVPRLLGRAERGGGGPGAPAAGGGPARLGEARWPWFSPPGMPEGLGLAALLAVLFVAVAVGAWPVVRRLTRRLELLKQGVEAFGGGALHQRVSEEGRDEVAAVAASFNRAATRVQALLRSHQSLLANASHELRSPLTRLKMALAMLEESEPESGPTERAALKREIDANIAELDALVEEVLMSSRLDAKAALDQDEPVALLPLAAEEAARVGAEASGEALQVRGDERLLRRALRNLLENGRRYGGSELEVTLARRGPQAELRVCDRGPGVPEAYRERIFEAFFRLPGHAERAGGVGLGLALVRQIAERHGGHVSCEPREGGGSCFVLVLPLG